MTTTFRVTTAVALLCLSTLAAHADGLGTQVTGSLTFAGQTANQFDPANGSVYPIYANFAGNTVTIGPGIEFGSAQAAQAVTITADFTGSTLSFTATGAGILPSFEATFKDAYFSSFQQISSSVNGVSVVSGPLNYAFSGDTLDLSYTGNSSSAVVVNSIFTYNQPATAATPEPSTLALLGTGLFGVVGVARRRLLRS